MKLLSPIKGKVVFAKNWFLKLGLIKKVALIIFVVGILWFGVKPLITQGQEQKIEYQTAVAEKGTLISSVTATGTVSSGSSSDIVSDATGIVKEVSVQNGDVVSAGDPIALITLDQNSLQLQTQAYANYLSAQNAVNTAKSKMNSLQAALFQANQTFVNGAGTENPITDDPQYIIQKANWQQAEADYNNQANVIAQAEAALASASLSYAQLSSTITAPISGVVSNLTITPGLSLTNVASDSTNESNAGQSIGAITLEDGTPQAAVNLPEIDIVTVEVGQKVTLTLDAFPDKTFTGKVSAINTTGSTSSGVTSYPVTITFDTDVKNMYPNMAVSATLITDIKNDVLLVPSGAVQTTDGTSTVRVMKNGQVTSVPVEVGDSNDTQTEIISGITEGETVVTGQIGGTTNASPTSQGSTGASPFGNSGFGGGGGAMRSAGGPQMTIIQK